MARKTFFHRHQAIQPLPPTLDERIMFVVHTMQALGVITVTLVTVLGAIVIFSH